MSAPPTSPAAGPTDAPRRPGRPRDPQTDTAIITATREVLAECGFGGFTVDAVAARAGVGKATIYRRWPSRETLLFDCIAASTNLPSDPDTGNLRDDLVGLFSDAYRLKRQDDKDHVMTALLAESAVNPELKRLMHDFLRKRRSTTLKIIERGIARGELPADTDRDLAIDLITGPLFYRLTLSDRRVDEDVVRSVVDTVLAGLARPTG